MNAADELRDLMAAIQAEEQYRSQATFLSQLARDLKTSRNMGMSADVVSHYAFVALNAARAEFFDPRPEFLP